MYKLILYNEEVYLRLNSGSHVDPVLFEASSLEEAQYALGVALKCYKEDNNGRLYFCPKSFYKKLNY